LKKRGKKIKKVWGGVASSLFISYIKDMKQKAIKVLKDFQEQLELMDESTFDTLSIDNLYEVISAAVSIAEEELEEDKRNKLFERINQGLGLQR
jgi:hypothetical protein